MELPSDLSAWDPRYRQSPFRLRFELGGETFGVEQPVPRFVQAMERARQLSSEVFAPSRQVVGVAAAWSNSGDDLFAAAEDGFDALAQAGFTAAPLTERQAPLWPDEAEADQIPARWRVFDLTSDTASRDVLLWCRIAYEMAVTPKAPVMSYLADFERGITLHVYDDRGLDITANTRAPLSSLYATRSDWLLDYDRSRMKAAFG